ncbi:MAG: hypothetical protein ACTSSE_07270 [Candidatus Thorarchaeota archaeon]
MSRKLVTITLVAILLSLTIISGSVHQSSADIMDSVYVTVSGTITNSSNLIMPEAEANIKMIRDVSGTVTVNVSCSFLVVSNQTMNASLAFVYPKAWRVYGGPPGIQFTIHINHTEVNHTLVSWENVTSEGFIADPEVFGGTWVENADFVLFSSEMIANHTYEVKVKTNVYPLITAHSGGFSYIVGSATTFLGQTHQKVEILLVEEEPFDGYVFFPDQHLVESSNESGTVASWDFIIDNSTNIDIVGIAFSNGEYRGNPPPPPIPDPILLNLVAIVVVVVVIGVLYRRYVRNAT